MLALALHHRYNLVSIHAPAGGATEDLDEADVFSMVSIHAPAGGATSEARYR